MRHGDLDILIGMAEEARAFEASADDAPRLPNRSAAWRVAAWTSLGGIAAALALWLAPWPTQTPTLPAPAPLAPAPVAQQSADPSMVLALFRDRESECECLVWQEASFGSRDMTDVRGSELVAAALKGACVGQRADLLLVVGLQGPRESLPPTREAAHALASCMAGGTAACGADAGCYGAGAMECLPAGVRVVAEGPSHPGR